jgi:hypothetical protein
MSTVEAISEAVDGVGLHLASPLQPQVELFKAIRAARTEVKAVGESGHNDFDNYDYSTLGDYITACDGAMAKHGLLLFVLNITPEWSTSHSQKMPARVVVHVTGELVHAATGQSIRAEGWGEAFDKGDKALYKAITGARKYLIACLFNIYTGDDPETESVEDGDVRKQKSGNSQRSRGDRPQQRQQGSAEPPKGAPPSSEKKPESPLIKGQKAFVGAKAPADFYKLLKHLDASELFTSDRVTWEQLYTFAGRNLEARVQKGEWKHDDPDVDSLYGALTNLGAKLTAAATGQTPEQVQQQQELI